jgi:hypothetical protein
VLATHDYRISIEGRDNPGFTGGVVRLGQFSGTLVSTCNDFFFSLEIGEREREKRRKKTAINTACASVATRQMSIFISQGDTLITTRNDWWQRIRDISLCWVTFLRLRDSLGT